MECGAVGLVRVWQGKIWQTYFYMDWARRGEARLGKAWRGRVWYGQTKGFISYEDVAWLGQAQSGAVRCGKAKTLCGHD